MCTSMLLLVWLPHSFTCSAAQVICDVLALEEAGHVSPGVLEDVLAYIPQEDQFAPLLAYDQCYNMRTGTFTRAAPHRGV